MQVTSVTIHPNSNPAMPKVLAFAKVEFDNEFVIPEVRLVRNERGVFASMPSKRLDEGWVEMCYPFKPELRERITSAVYAEFKKVMKGKEVVR